MSNFLTDIWQEVIQYYEALVVFMPKLMMASVLLFVTWVIARQVRKFSDKRLKRQMEDPLLASFLATMTRTVIFIVGLSFVFKILGLSGITASILAGAGITAFIVGFALRDIGENFLAGILMAFKRPFRVGDFVESGAIRGRVVALNIRDTQLKTPDGKDVFVPNANIIKNPLINYTIDGFLRFDFVVGVPSGADQELVMQEMEAAVAGITGVVKNRRKIAIFVSGIAPGRLDLTVSFWIDTFKSKETSDAIRSNVIRAVQKVLEPGL